MRNQFVIVCALALGLTTQVGAQAVNPGGVPVPVNSAVMDIESRFEQLQNEVQQLRGVVEEQSQTIADLQRKQANMYSDLDNRVQALTPASPAPAAAATQAPATVSGAAAAGAVQPQDVPPVSAAGVATPASTPAPAGVAAQTVAGQAAAGKGIEKDRYQLAYDSLRNARYDQSIQMFEALLVDFPNGEYADNSQYWLGEAYGRKRDVEKAKLSFTKLLSKYPNSQKVPDAMLKLGYIEYEQQNMPKSREYLTQVIKAYPETPASFLAAKKLAQLPQ